jgi:hypothetical protein|nr:MAG TPA: Protein of unknown function (DUF321) [Caudoviricetes sp.]
MTIDDLRTFMIQWNNKFPYDRWWRKKHGVAFLSPEHRGCSFIHQMMEFEEDMMFNQVLTEKTEKENDPYIPNIGEWIKRSNSIEIEEYDIASFRAEAEMMAKLEEIEKEKNHG